MLVDFGLFVGRFGTILDGFLTDVDRFWAPNKQTSKQTSKQTNWPGGMRVSDPPPPLLARGAGRVLNFLALLLQPLMPNIAYIADYIAEYMTRIV